MGRGVTTCDWLKRVIQPSEEIKSLVIDDVEYVFSLEGYNAFISFLNGSEMHNTPVVHNSHDIVQETTHVAVNHNEPDITKPLPKPTQAESDRVLAESRIAPEFSTPALSDATKKREAQQKLKVLNAKIERQFTKDNAVKDVNFNWNPQNR